MNPGQVIKIQFPYSDPPKLKYCLGICLRENLFFVISSNAYRWAPPDSQITIYKNELACLNYDSFLDVSKTYAFSAEEIAQAEKKGIFDLSPDAIKRIRSRVAGQSYLPKEQKDKVLENFSEGS